MLAMRRGVADYIVKSPYNPGRFRDKIRIAVKRGRMKKMALDSERDHQIEVHREPGLTVIGFHANLSDKAFLEDAKHIFNRAFFKMIHRDRCVFDLRAMAELGEKDAAILRRLSDIFKEHDLFVIAGRHMGALLGHAELDERVGVFLSQGDLELFLKTNENK